MFHYTHWMSPGPFPIGTYLHVVPGQQSLWEKYKSYYVFKKYLLILTAGIPGIDPTSEYTHHLCYQCIISKPTSSLIMCLMFSEFTYNLLICNKNKIKEIS